MIKEIIYFTPGNAKDASLWSNVPFLYARELERRGIIVRYVNINPHKIICYLYNLIAHYIHILVNRDYRRGFNQSNLARWLATPIIRKAIKQFPSADCCIVMGCGYANYWSDMPTVIFAEGCFEKVIRVKFNREPNIHERPIIRQHRKAFNHAAFISLLFPRDLDYIKEIAPCCNVQYKGSNVINNFREGDLTPDIVDNKRSSFKILFIGGRHYLNGAKILVKAFQIIRERYPSAELNIIGIEDRELDECPQGVICHGYLDKANSQQCIKYYDLLINSRVYVNPTPAWGAYSSCIEAMFYYTPVVVYPYEHFVFEFGKEIDFGVYNTEYSATSIAESIISVFEADNYETMAMAAHNRIKDYTYERYIDWTFEELEKTEKFRNWQKNY